jgi:hypothetical protein
VCWLFPGKTIHIAAPCLDCGDPMTVEVQDGRILRADPEAMVGYACSEIGGPPENRAWR